MIARLFGFILRWVRRAIMLFLLFMLLIIGLYAVVNPPITHTIFMASLREDNVQQKWIPLEGIAPVMVRSAVAAEDANFCRHWGIDMSALRLAIAGGAERGGSTISQQTVKNVYLWQKRSWIRKGIEAVMTPVVELIWTKRRIIEVYLNVAEFDRGVFGVEAASLHYFGVYASELTARQAARLAAVLPSPKKRNAANPSPWLRQRAAAIMDGAATIRRDGRSDCFSQS